MSVAVDVLVVSMDAKGKFRAAGDVEIALAGALLIGDLLGGRSLRDLTGLDSGAVESVGNRARGAVSIVGSQAVAGGVMRKEENRLLGVIPRSRYVLVDVEARDALVTRLRAALQPGATPSRADAAFALICAVSGVSRQWTTPLAGAEERAAVATHLNGLATIAGDAVTTIIAAVRRQYGRREAATSDVAPFVLLPVDGTEDYGDQGPAGGGDSSSGDGGSDGGSDGGGGGGGD